MKKLSRFGIGTMTAALTAIVAAAPAYAYVQPIWLEANQSYYMPQQSNILRVAVTNPKIADINIVNKRAINIIALTPGSTSLTVWTVDGMRQEFVVNVSPADSGTARMIEKAIALPHVTVQKVGDRILLRGTVQNQYEKELAYRIASLFVNQAQEHQKTRSINMGVQGSGESQSVSNAVEAESVGLASSDQVINLLEMVNPDQINIEAMVLEIRTTDAEQLGAQYASLDPTQSSDAGISSTHTITRGNTNTSSQNYSSGGSWTGEHQTVASVTNTSGKTDASSTSQTTTQTFAGNQSVSQAGAQDGNDSDTYTYVNKHSTSNVNVAGIGQFFFGESYGPQRSKGSHWYSRNWLFTHFSQINVQLQALVTSGRARVISRPNITTMSGRTASILVGGEIPYPTKTGDSSNVSIEYKPYGIQLDLLQPQVDRYGNITSELQATVSSLDWSNSVTANGFKMPGLSTKKAVTTVNIPSGMTMAIGGLLNSEDSKSTSKVPILGDIPIIGELFKSHNNSHEDTEIMVLITPRVVNATNTVTMGPTMSQAYEEIQKSDRSRKKVNLNDVSNGQKGTDQQGAAKDGKGQRK